MVLDYQASNDWRGVCERCVPGRKATGQSDGFRVFSSALNRSSLNLARDFKVLGGMRWGGTSCCMRRFEFKL